LRTGWRAWVDWLYGHCPSGYYPPPQPLAAATCYVHMEVWVIQSWRRRS